MHHGPLTSIEDDLIGRVRDGLAHAFPGRSFHVEGRPMSPAPRRGWLYVVVEEAGGYRRTLMLQEPVARHRVTADAPDALALSLLDSFLQKLDRVTIR